VKVRVRKSAEAGVNFVSKYGIALKEAREILYWLRLLDAPANYRMALCDVLLREADGMARLS
jgi:hypothetical protein